MKNTVLTIAAAMMLFAGASNAATLAERHAGYKLDCMACHSTQPKAGDMVTNDQCMKCHGPKKTLEEKFASQKEQNPHKNHLGDVDCTLCHKGHAQSQSYCLECHQDFKMPMK